MVVVNLRTLASKLNPMCLRALEGAAGLGLSRSNYNIEGEHLLLKLLETADTGNYCQFSFQICIAKTEITLIT